MYMAKLASRNGGDDPSVTYGDLAAVVQRKESMEFLHDILPKKVSIINIIAHSMLNFNGLSPLLLEMIIIPGIT